MLRLRDINPSHPALAPNESALLRSMVAHRNDYLSSGDWRAASAMGVATLMVWQALIAPADDVPDTRAGDL